MTTITIPKSLHNQDQLVAISSDQYESFLTWQKQSHEVKTFRPTVAEKRALKLARLDYKKGNYLTLDELRRKLGFARS